MINSFLGVSFFLLTQLSVADKENSLSIHDFAVLEFKKCMDASGYQQVNKNLCIDAVILQLDRYPATEAREEKDKLTKSKEFHSCHLTGTCKEELRLH